MKTSNIFKFVIAYFIVVSALLLSLSFVNAFDYQCFIPYSAGSTQQSIGSNNLTSETTLQQLLNNSGYVISVANQQTNDYYWTASGKKAKLEITYLGGYTNYSDEIVGYYLNGNIVTFTPIFRKATSLSGAKYTIYVNSGDKVGFASSTGNIFYTEPAFNADSFNHFLTFDLGNEFLLGHEDILAGGDKDFQDMVFSVKRVDCLQSCSVSSDCGQNGLLNQKFCKNNNVYDKYKTNTCNLAGNAGSYCSNYSEDRIVESCANGCSNGACIFECSANSDCDDDNLYTYDQCLNPGTVQASCSHGAITCFVDNDCGITGLFGNEFCSNNDIFKNYKISRCLNPGTLQSSCNVTTNPLFLTDCGDNFCGNYGNNFCKSDNLYHSRICQDKGCSSGSCFSNSRIEETLAQTCNFGCLDNQCVPECSSNSQCSNGKVCYNTQCVVAICSEDRDCNDGNSQTLDRCLNPGVGNAQCIHEQITCTSNCGSNSSSTEESLDTCNINSDCRADYLSENYCSNDQVYNAFHDFSCVSGHCVDVSNVTLVKECKKDCSNGKCLYETTSSDGEHAHIQEETTETAILVLGEDSSNLQNLNVKSSAGNVTEEVTKLGVKVQTVDNNYGSNLIFWLAGLVLLLLVIFIIVFIVMVLR